MAEIETRGNTRHPPGAYGPTATRVLLAVIAGHTHITDLVAATGCPRSTVHGHLVRLRADGFVTWDPLRRGTLRPLVAIATPLGEPDEIVR